MSARWDLVALGEVMLRLDPGEGRIKTARTFNAWEGGGEYNVARGLKQCFGMNTTVVTALVDNPVGRLIENMINTGAVDTSHILWQNDDGVGRTVRNGLNFTERGFGARAAKGCSDRGNSATSQLKPGDIDWERIFGDEGARWLHTGGIFAALSESTPEVAKEAMIAAKKQGAMVSYDLNYRPSLWKSIGGKSKAQEVNRELAQYVDLMIGNEEDFTAALGFEVQGTSDDLSNLNPEAFAKMAADVQIEFPNIKGVATTLRVATNATQNDWSAIYSVDGKTYQAQTRRDCLILDRVGGGDSFASGLIYGILEGKEPQWSVECGAAHGLLAMTTPGDTSMASLDEVLAAMKPGTARIDR